MSLKLPLAADSSAIEIGSSFGGSRLTGCLGAKFLGSATWSDIVKYNYCEEKKNRRAA